MAGPEKAHLREVLALLPPFVALALELVLGPVFHPSVWFLFYPAVFLSSWIGGLRAGVAASAISAVSVLWRFLPPEQSFAKAPGQYATAAVFLATGILFGVFHDRLRRANRRAADALGASRSARDEAEWARRQIAALVEQAPEGIFVADMDGRYTDVNAAGCRMLGYTREELVGKRILDLIPAERVGQLEREKGQLLEHQVQVSEWVLRRRDGTWLPVEISASILPDGRWQAFVRDISIRKRLEQALHASNADLQRAQSVARVGSWSLDVRRNELLWSDEEYRIFGVSPGTPMTYGAFLACVHPDDRELVDRAWTAGLRGEPYDVEHRIVVNGEVRWVRERADLELDEHQTVVGGIGITQDITDRKRQEEALREAQERLELALRGADLASWDWNVETGEVVLDARWAEMRGFRPEDVPAHVSSWTSGVHPEDWPRVQRALDDHFQGRTPEYEVEHRARMKSGGWIWILDRGKVFARNQEGRPIRMVGTEFDITDRKRAEEELRLAEAKASGILSIAADAIISIDEQARITLFNRAAERIFGYAAEEVIGAPLDVLIPERFRARHGQRLEAFAASEEVGRLMSERDEPVFGLRRSGEEFPAEASISRLEVGGRRILTVALRDVTEQERIEGERRFLTEVGSVLASTLEIQATLASIGQLMTGTLADVCIVYVLDDDGTVRRLKAVTRDPARAWIGDAVMLVPMDPSRAPEIWSELEANRSVLMERVSSETIGSFAASEEHLRVLRAIDPRSIIMVPLFAHRKLVGAIALVSSTPSRIFGPADVRLAEQAAQRAAFAVDNAQLYEKARRAIRSRDDVLGVVAHDLRNPLGSILVQAALLRRPGEELERRARKSADMIERSARRMNRLIQDLLDVTRLEEGQLSVDRVPVSARQAVRDAVEGQEQLAAAASVGLEVEVADEIPDVWADRDRLLQIFENLIGNAVRFTPPGGTITVGAAPQDGEVLFQVADTGSGIPPEDLPHVFDRFWQAQKGEAGGAGLGLAIVKGLVEAHGGRVRVESTPGRGTTFYFTIPAAPGHEPVHVSAPHGT